MVSNAREDFPLPLKPVITTSLFLGILRSIFWRLWTLAPKISSFGSVDASSAIAV
jgi:hypothetical protein